MSLDRFIKAQELDYELALNEIKNGRKLSHGCGIYFLKSKA